MKDYRKLYKEHYGIDFGSEYVIHHIDENRNNNDISNLILIPSTLHSQFHGVMQELRHAGSGASIDLKVLQADEESHQSVQWFGYFYNRLYPIMSELSYWIYEKQRADKGIEDAYWKFRRYQ